MVIKKGICYIKIILIFDFRAEKNLANEAIPLVEAFRIELNLKA